MSPERELVIRKITEMPAEKVMKVLIFMAGMDAGCALAGRSIINERRKHGTDRQHGEIAG